MSDPELEISRRKRCRNWLRGAMALRFVGNGMQQFIEEQIHRHYLNMVDKLKNTQVSMAGSCSVCTNDNLLPYHARTSNKQCIQKNRQNCFCNNPTRIRRHCPGNLCGTLYDEIVKSHGLNSPLWINTDTSRWFDDEWEVAKCFLGSQGYGDVHSAKDTDLAGLLSIAINNTFIQNNMDSSIDKVTEIRDIRNSILHSACQELEDQVVMDYIVKMKAFLNDETAFADNEDARKAKVNLLKLLDESQCLITLKEELDLKEESSKAQEENEKCFFRDIISQQRDILQQLNRYGALQGLQSSNTTDMTLNSLPKTGNASNVNQAETFNVVPTIQIQADSNQISFNAQSSSSNEENHRLQQECLQNTREMQKNLEELLRRQDRDRKQRENQNILARKRIKEDLISLYKKSCITTDVSPSLPEREVDIDELYVPPFLLEQSDVHKDFYYGNAYYNLNRSKQNVGIGRTISVEEFLSHENMSNKTMLIIGEAGVGKTSFCKKLLSDWCKFQTAHQEKSSELAYHSFLNKDYVFFVKMKYCQDFMSIEEMIRKTLVNEINHATLMEILQTESERCLVILDGLDNWSIHTTNSSPTQNECFPSRELVSQLTVIYTTRPWKLALIRPRSRDIDVTTELCGIVDCHLDLFVEKILKHLQREFGRESLQSPKDCTAYLRQKHLSHVLQSPLLVKLFISIWFNGRVEDMSYSGIYTFIVDMLLAKIDQSTIDQQTHAVSQKVADIISKRFHSAYNILKYLDKYIIPLAKFSFNLFVENGKRFCYKYHDSELEAFGLDKTTIKDLMRAGILTERVVYTQSATRKCSEVSFLHDTFIEYFAALHLSLIPIHVANLPLTIEGILDKRLLFKFLSGVRPGSLLNISKGLSHVVDSDENIIEYRKGESRCAGFVVEIQKLIMDCVHESACNAAHVGPVQLRDIIISDDLEVSFETLSRIDPQSVRSIYCIYIPVEVHDHLKTLGQMNELEFLELRQSYFDSFTNTEMLETYIKNNKLSIKCIGIHSYDLRNISLFAEEKFDHLRKLVISECLVCFEQVKNLLISSPSIIYVRIMEVVCQRSDATKSSKFNPQKKCSVRSLRSLIIIKCEFNGEDLVSLLKDIVFENDHLKTSLRAVTLKTSYESNISEIKERLDKLSSKFEEYCVEFVLS